MLRWADGPPQLPAAKVDRRDTSVRRAGIENPDAGTRILGTEPAATLPDAPSTPPGTPGTALSLDACIRQGLESNPTIRAARFNVQALRYRIPQVTALDDPLLSNTIYPIPSAAPQYSLMGYMPYGALLAQQFPWSGTLRLRGEAAEHDVRIALQELAATELDVVAGVKRAYHDLRFNERALELLRQNRGLAVDFLGIARSRYRLATAGQADVLRAEVVVSDVDREIENTRRAESEARSDLVRLLHLEPSASVRTGAAPPVGDVPAELDRLARLAEAARPELRGRLEAIARDRKAVELARKRYYPNLTLGLVYQQMERTNAMMPETAGGMPNVGLFVGMNLPVDRRKLAAGVCEAQARAAADAQLFEAERDQVRRDIKDAYAQVSTQRNVLELLRRSNRPTARRLLELTAAEYRAGNAGTDYLSLVSAWRELLQVELQIAQLEAELGKSLATLERAVGVELNEHPPGPEAVGPEAAAPAPAASPSPFRREDPR
jgi:outer membrane protein TolC